MQEYQQRVIEEKKQLDERLAKLSAFISGSDKFRELTIQERSRLSRQESIMREYSEVLFERIANFTS